MCSTDPRLRGVRPSGSRCFRCAWADVSRYCSLKTTPIHDNYFFVDDMIEKPKKGQEFSNYSILGRVLLTPEIYDLLAHTKPGAGGEIQLTDAMAEYAAITAA